MRHLEGGALPRRVALDKGMQSATPRDTAYRNGTVTVTVTVHRDKTIPLGDRGPSDGVRVHETYG